MQPINFPRIIPIKGTTLATALKREREERQQLLEVQQLMDSPGARKTKGRVRSYEGFVSKAIGTTNFVSKAIGTTNNKVKSSGKNSGR